MKPIHYFCSRDRCVNEAVFHHDDYLPSMPWVCEQCQGREMDQHFDEIAKAQENGCGPKDGTEGRDF